MLNKGRFIVVEGLEGAGKSTAIHTIKRFLEELGHRVITTREPGGTRVGEIVRGLLKETTSGEPLDPRSELLLFYASRVQLIERVIRPSLQQGTWVLADRFELSTWAYQGGGRNLNQEVIAYLSKLCLHDLQPDLTIFLDIDPRLGLKRAKKRSKADRIERESLEFFNAVHQRYHDQIHTMKGVVIIDANQSLPCVQEAIRSELHAFCSALEPLDASHES